MRDDTNDWFHESIRILTYNRNQRVWSIIVTLFGDLAREPGDRISGTVLSRITDPMGIKPEAMRVALHRLRGDGWIQSEREGRISHYSLTDSGLEQSRAASPRIYSREITYPDSWQLSVAPTSRQGGKSARDKAMRRKGVLPVASGVFLAPAQSETVPDSLTMVGPITHMPEWLREKIAPEAVMQAYEDLNGALDQFEDMLGAAPRLSPVQIATLRTIIVHVWRRALFSHADLPAAFFPTGWKGPHCRVKALGLLERLGRPELKALELSI